MQWIVAIGLTFARDPLLDIAYKLQDSVGAGATWQCLDPPRPRPAAREREVHVHALQPQLAAPRVEPARERVWLAVHRHSPARGLGPLGVARQPLAHVL